MEEEQKEKVSSDERGEGEKKTNVPSEGEWVEEMGVDVKEDQVLAALGNIGRWQVQIIMITGYNFRSSQCNHMIKLATG